MTSADGEGRPLLVLVVSFNSAEDLNRMGLRDIRSVADEVVVFDNASKDRSVEVAEDAGALVIRSDVNLGFGSAANLAMRDFPGHDVLVLNPDVTIDTARVAELHSLLRQNPGVGILAPDLKADESEGANGRSFQTLALVVARRSRLGRLSWSQRLMEHHFTPRGTSDDLQLHDWVQGAAMMVRWECWAATGGFDPRYFLYCEDMDLCHRAGVAGFRVAVAREVAADHGYRRGSLSVGRLWWLHLRSSLRWFAHHPSYLFRIKA